MMATDPEQRDATAVLAYLYAYRADLYCPGCILEAMGLGPDKAGMAYLANNAGLSLAALVAEDLANVAADYGINRDDETTFDSGEFPKVVTRDMLGEANCSHCGHPESRHQWNYEDGCECGCTYCYNPECDGQCN